MTRRLSALFRLTLLAGIGVCHATDTSVLRSTLANGLRVVIVRDTLAPVVTVEMNYLAGSDESPAGLPGTAHALEHMMFRGSPGLSGNQLNEVISDLGGQFNAWTQAYRTQYFSTVPASDLGLLLHVEALRMRGLNLDKMDWGKERSAIDQEVTGDESNPNFVLGARVRAALFKGTPYAELGTGSVGSLKRTDVGELGQFHASWYVPNNAVLVIAGDVDPTITLQQVQRQFGSIPKGVMPSKPTFRFAPLKGGTIEVSQKNSTGMVALAYRLPGARSPDVAALNVLSAALSLPRSEFGSMVFDGTALQAGFKGELMPEASVGLALAVYRQDQDPVSIAKRLRAILTATAINGLDPRRIEAAKRRLLDNMDFEADSVSGLANDWSNAITLYDADSPDALRRAVKAVTPLQVNALARRYLSPGHALTVMMNPRRSDGTMPPANYGKAEHFADVPVRSVPLPEWAEHALSQAASLKPRLKPKRYVLDNGLVLIVQPESVSNTVELLGEVRNNADMEQPAGKEGVSNALAAMFNFGSMTQSRAPFEHALDAIGAREHGGTSFALAVPSDRFAEGLRLLADNELHPAITEANFRFIQGQLAPMVLEVNASAPFLAAMETDRHLLPVGDPGLRHLTYNTVADLKLNDLKAYYTNIFRPDLTTIVVVGSVDPAKVRTQVEQAFGGWQSQGNNPVVDYPSVPLNKAALVHVVAAGQQDKVSLTELMAVRQSDDDRFALSLGNQILSKGFSSRLYRDLRSQHGLVYSVNGVLDLGSNRSKYSFVFGATPGNVGSARKRLLAEVERMRTEPVSAAELQQAKGTIIRDFVLGDESFSGIALDLLDVGQKKLPLNADQIAVQRYLALTADQVRTAFAKYVRPNDFVTTVLGPRNGTRR
jgi:zinc protease